MRLSLSEIRANALAFAADWKDVASERGEAQPFWEALFAVFGIKRRSVASVEETVRNIQGQYDRIDVFYSGVMIGEHKSLGEDLSRAASQAFDYVQSLTREGRDDEIPQYIVVSDFARIVIYDLDAEDSAQPLTEFPTDKLHEYIAHFGFLSGYATRPVDPEDPINIKAVEILGALHDELAQGGYTGHVLERFLVRVLFCLFAEDTGIFEPDAFKLMVEASRRDGSDLGPQLARLFKVLNTPENQRSPALPDELKAMPYVNGLLFHEDLGFADFNKDMRQALVDCCKFRWAQISPAVFGSLFQSIMAGESGKKKRRQIGAHYTSERDILKLIRSLLLDELQAELAACGQDKRKLQIFHDKLANLRFLDPACGCGNFLVITYRELRNLELTALLALHGDNIAQQRFNLDAWLKLDVDQMHGIEIEEWPARIAEVAMWLIDHQMNQKVGEAFGRPVLRLPLKKSAKIAHANALRIDWNDVLPAEQCSYVLGNPPFVGAKFQTDAQRDDIDHACKGIKNAGLLDYVCGWYVVASSYVPGTRIRVAFVSTNSITQGEQVGVIWPELFRRGIKIHFAHRTFKWMSEARGKAHVHVVIIGFGAHNRNGKMIYDYSDANGDPQPIHAANISPYLVVGPDVAIANRSTPLCHAPEMAIGNKPIDDGNYLFTTPQMRAFVRGEPGSKPLFRRFFGADDFISNVPRWCLWLRDTPAATLRRLPAVVRRIDAVKRFRAASKSAPTRKLAATPTRFHVEFNPQTAYLLIPRVSSERRDYIPMGYVGKNSLPGDSCLVIRDARLYHFGVLTSQMHMAWVHQVCGRLESRYRYSNKLVYNNFPWPKSATDRQKIAVEAAAQAVLDTRRKFKGQTLADLYDPLVMPKVLRDAHKHLDRAVDKCYRAQPFLSERARVEYLFERYAELTAAGQMSLNLQPPRQPKRRPKAR